MAFNQIIYTAMAPAWSKASEVAKEQGKPTAILITTTPGDLATEHGKFAYDIKDMAGVFNESLYDYDADDVITWMAKNSKNRFLYIEYRYQQLGHKDPDKWFKEQCEILQFDWPKIRREILLQWSNSTSNTPFDLDDLKDLRYMMLEPDETLSFVINKYYKLNVYKELDPNEKYLVCVDPAKGKGEQADSTAIVIVNAKTQFPHAIFKSNVIQYKETFRFLYTLIMKHIPNSVIVVENNIGDTIIEYLVNSPLKHLVYYEFDNDPTKEKRKNGVVQPKNKSNISYGVTTSAQNRPKYFDILFDYVHNNKERVNVSELVSEIECLEYKTPTRIEAASSKHDDIIMAYLMSQYVMQYGNNRARFGLFFSEMVDSSRNVKTSSSLFDSNSSTFSNKKSDLYNNPFLTALLVQPETIEELERKWAKSYHIHHDDDEEGSNGFSVFAGNKNSFGVSVVDDDTFFTLNTKPVNEEGNDDLFGSHKSSIYDDDGGGNWF